MMFNGTPFVASLYRYQLARRIYVHGTERPRRVWFPHGLIAFAWISIGLLGPTALFLTWFGDCSAEVCPSPTTTDWLLYRLDVIAWIAIGLVGIIATVRPRRGWFAVLTLLGLGIAGQGVAGLMGARGFYAFPIILPAGAVLAIGGFVGVQACSGSSRFARVSAATGAGLGSLIYVLLPVVLLGLPAAVAGNTGGLLVVALTLVAVVLLTIWLRESQSR
jgi:hypothetical protein